MISVDDKVMNAWQELLDGSISVPVYIEGSVPDDEVGNYVELRLESEHQDDTKHSFQSDVVIITDIITRFSIAPNRSVASGIDNEIKTLVKTTPGLINLVSSSDIQIVNVIPTDASFLQEYESGIIYYRKIVRYTHRIVQT
jgi:hypothetical protein